MEAQQVGIKETKEMAKFIISLGMAVDKSLEDGKIGLDDAMYFYNALLSAKDAFDKADQIPTELKDLDQAEAQELLDFVKAEFDIADDKLELTVVKALETGLKVYDLVQQIKSLRA